MSKMKVKHFLSMLKTAVAEQTVYNNKYPYNCGYYDGTKYSFDCWNLIKSILGGWYPCTTKGYYVSPKAFPTGDVTGLDLLNKCTNISQDFSKLKTAGTYLYMRTSPHSGIYVGDTVRDGKTYNVIECTGAWDKKVLYSYVDKNGKRYRYKGGSQNGAWTDHGLLTPYVDYEEQPSSSYTVTIVLNNEKDKNDVKEAMRLLGFKVL